ncbi:hypothetical protein H6F32_16700 [Anabaena sp. FACHB-1237]|nr:hypothetical protein [Anabaena sp. FACHB-1237]
MAGLKVSVAIVQELAVFSTVKKFISLEGISHCPQDEAPDLVNSILLDWIGE